MTQANTGDIPLAAGPCCYRFKVIDDEVVIFDGEVLYFLVYILGAVVPERFQEVDSATFSKEKTESLGKVLHRIAQLNVCLRATNEHIHLTVGTQCRDYIFGPRQMTITGSLNRI